MRGIRNADLSVETFSTVTALPPEAVSLLDQSNSLFASKAWWNVVLRHAMPAEATPAFMLIRERNRLVALLPMMRIGSRLHSLTAPYTCEYEPLFAEPLDPATRISALSAFARSCRRYGIVRLEALPADLDSLTDLATAARQAGLRQIRFDHFGNWHENVEGLDWITYLQRRPGALRETIRRRSNRAARLPGVRFDLYTQPAEMDQATEFFEAVYQRSWKTPEPHPTFNTALMRAMADEGQLRFGMWSVASQPVAVQLWVVRNGAAIVLKLAHDEAYRQHSPGTVLTALMLQHLLDKDHVRRIDFGRGDDAYKQGWATSRRQRIGLLLVDPFQPSGTVALLRHAAGRVRAWLANPLTQPDRSAAGADQTEHSTK